MSAPRACAWLCVPVVVAKGMAPRRLGVDVDRGRDRFGLHATSGEEIREVGCAADAVLREFARRILLVHLLQEDDG